MENEFYDKSLEHKKKTINNLNLQREYLIKYKNDFITYFRKCYLNECKREEDPFAFSMSCAFLGALSIFVCLLFYSFDGHGYNPIALAIGASVIILSTIYERIILPIYHSHKRYNRYLNDIDTKLEIIKNDMLEKGLIVEKEEVNKDKKINDSFVKMIKDTITKIKSL